MEKIYLKKEEVKKLIPIFKNEGTENFRYYTEIDGIKYVINIFQKQNSDIIKDKIYKLERLNDFNFSKNIIVPDKIVYIDNMPMGFSTKLQENTRNLEEYVFKSKKKKIELLQKAKDLVIELNEKNIVHCDINNHNFITDGNEVYLLDMLSCEFDDFKNYKNNILYTKYIKKFGYIDKSFDIYSFNMMTYGFLYKIYLTSIEMNILNGNFSIFEKKEIKEMYNNLLLFDDNSYDDNFIIDEYQKKIKLK